MYRTLLRLYPADYYARFASEMATAFDRASADVHRSRTRFLFSELRGLLIAIAREWLAKLTANPIVRARTLPDLRKMRPAGVSKEAWFANPHSR
jgi:hypothetical protein